MLRVNCRCSSSSPPLATANLSLQGVPDNNGELTKDHILNLSPRPSYHHLNPSSAELLNEIATLEVQIMRLEQHLLSLYRTAFQQHLPTLSMEKPATHLQYKVESPPQRTPDQPCFTMEPGMWRGGSGHHDEISSANGLAGSDGQTHATTPKSSLRKFRKKNDADPGHCSLADHLGSSGVDTTLDNPAILSEDIVKCISSIYCKLAGPALSQTTFSVSSSSSLSSSSTFSPRNLSDTWSPNCGEETISHCQFQGSKEQSGPYAAMIEVLKICLDDDSFNYAAKMLQNFRSLVKSLEKVDPRKLKREEKLAFWINIHNALVMHAYLAYGTQSCGSTSILKAAYNVGGHCINAHVIQSSILGIRSHYSARWLQALLSPGKKFKTGSTGHIYGIEYPEQLVHFALCSGAYSDPVVRVYRAKTIFQDLKLAKEEFIQATVYIQKQTKIYLPKIICYYAKDMSLSMPQLLEVVSSCLPADRQESIKRCMKGRPDKCIYWLPQSSTFRYLIHRDAVGGGLSL